MTKLFLAFVACAILLPLWGADRDQASERFIVEGERQWADSTTSGDTTQIEKLIADDFRGVDPDGKFYDKATELADTRREAKSFVSNRLNEVKVRFYGETAVAQGSESWERRTGEPKLGRYVWTDTWVRRDGRWQVVAAEDVTVDETRK